MVHFSAVPRGVKRLMVGLAGGILLLAGLAMVILPGPAVLVIPAALGLLALEFAWARRILDRLRGKSKAPDLDS